jgi:hypothetical protein
LLGALRAHPEELSDLRPRLRRLKGSELEDRVPGRDPELCVERGDPVAELPDLPEAGGGVLNVNDVDEEGLEVVLRDLRHRRELPRSRVGRSRSANLPLESEGLKPSLRRADKVLCA